MKSDIATQEEIIRYQEERFKAVKATIEALQKEQDETTAMKTEWVSFKPILYLILNLFFWIYLIFIVCSKKPFWPVV